MNVKKQLELGKRHFKKKKIILTKSTKFKSLRKINRNKNKDKNKDNIG